MVRSPATPTKPPNYPRRFTTAGIQKLYRPLLGQELDGRIETTAALEYLTNTKPVGGDFEAQPPRLTLARDQGIMNAGTKSKTDAES